MSGSPASWGNGKTGKCATFVRNAAQRITNSTTEFNYTVEDFSWCCWINKDSSALGTDTDMWAFTVGRADAGSRGYGLQVYQRSSGHSTIHVWFGSGKWGLTGIADGSWHHVAFTRKGTAIKVYLDGALHTSATFSGTLPTYTESAGVGLGLFFYSRGNIYPLTGSMSDFRIYNHTLSAKEVYELSRALIVHYPLSAPGNANPNLLTWTKNYTEASPLVHTSSAKDGYKYLGNDSLITVTPGKTYYVQLKSNGTLSASHAIGAGVVSDKFTFWFYIRNVGTSKGIGSYDRTTCFTSAFTGLLVNDPERQLYVWKWTAPSNAQDITLRINSYSDGTTAVTLKFWDFKIEEETYTSYVPSKNSAQYGELGYDTVTVRNTTGRDIDLVYSGTGYTHISGSPRYSTAIDFNQSAYLYNDSVPYTLTSFTVSFWLNPRINASSQHFIFGSFDSWPNNGVGMYRDTNRQTYSLIVRSDAESTYCSCGGHSYTLNAWTFFTLTWDGTVVKVFQNAELKTTKTYGLSGNCLFKNIYLGNSMFKTHPASETDEAAMSDFRIYGTALTADDVKYLYETSAAIDNNGDMFADSFEETEMLPRVGKEGLVYGSHLSESGGTVCAYTSAAKRNVDPNRSSWSYTPAADTNNSCMNGFYFERIEGIYNYRITLVVTWSGFADISTTSTNFSATFQGVTVKLDGSTLWNVGSNINSQLQAQGNLGTLAKGAASGTRLYDTSFTVPAAWDGTYKGQFVGIRTNYSNGTGKWTISKVRVYPADEHMADQASLCSSGAIQVRLADEVALA